MIVTPSSHEFVLVLGFGVGYLGPVCLDGVNFSEIFFKVIVLSLIN